MSVQDEPTTGIQVVVKANKYRGITFLPCGKQFGGYLPAGIYEVVGPCELAWSDLGRSRRDAACKVRRLRPHRVEGVETWYVGVNAGLEIVNLPRGEGVIV